MKKAFKWFVRLVACLVFVITIFESVISISIGNLLFPYYLPTIDKIILLGIIIFSFIASIITLFCSFKKVKIRICFVFILIPIILSIILAYKLNVPPDYSDSFLATKLNVRSKEECFRQASCGTKKEILDAVNDPKITKVGCDYVDHCKPAVFLKNPKVVSVCLGHAWEWKCSNENCQCFETSFLGDCFFADCP